VGLTTNEGITDARQVRRHAALHPGGQQPADRRGPARRRGARSARATLFVDGDDVFHWEEQVDIA